MTVARHAAGALLALLCLSLLPATAAADGAAPTAARVAIEVPATDAVRVGVPSHVSVALVEGSTGQVLVAQDATTRRPIASAIKLVTALSVIDALPADTVVTLGDEVRGVGGSSYGLRPGERRTVEDLLTGLLLRSGNDAAVALGVAVAGSEADFIARMSETLGALGIDARPASASGLEEADALSALELATVARAALDEPRIAALVRNEEVVRPDGRTIENRNRFVGVVEGATGLKTGFTNAAGFTLAASAERGGRELIAVVLGAHDDDQRLEIAARMIEHGFSATRPDDLASSLELRTSRGPVRFTTGPLPMTVPGDGEVRIAWSSSVRPEDAGPLVPLTVRGTEVLLVPTERLDGRTGTGGSAGSGLGAALVDGVYAALRPSTIAGDGATPLR